MNVVDIVLSNKKIVNDMKEMAGLWSDMTIFWVKGVNEFKGLGTTCGITGNTCFDQRLINFCVKNGIELLGFQVQEKGYELNPSISTLVAIIPRGDGSLKLARSIAKRIENRNGSVRLKGDPDQSVDGYDIYRYEVE